MHAFSPESLSLPPTPHHTLILPDEHATRALGAAVGEVCRSGALLGLVGDLGAGKTTFSQGLVAHLHGGEASSPTYTLVNEYEGRPRIYHFDLYRLESVDELEGIGFWDYVEDAEAVVLVEWIDRIPQAWSPPGLLIELRHTDGQRKACLWDTSPDRRWLGALAADDTA